MRLYLQRDIHGDCSRFTVYDGLYREKYYVTAVSGRKNRLVITDLSGNRAALISRMPLPLLQAYSISVGRRNIKLILNSGTSASASYYYGVSWHIRGSTLEKSFDIIDADNSIVASHSKCFNGRMNGYVLEILRDEQGLFCLASAVCVNLISINGDRECIAT